MKLYETFEPLPLFPLDESDAFADLLLASSEDVDVSCSVSLIDDVILFAFEELFPADAGAAITTDAMSM
jgi:hypothetical protein